MLEFAHVDADVAFLARKRVCVDVAFEVVKDDFIEEQIGGRVFQNDLFVADAQDIGSGFGVDQDDFEAILFFCGGQGVVAFIGKFLAPSLESV